MRKALFLFTTILVVQLTFANKVEKGFEALQILDYFRAKELFSKALEKEPAGGGFGLALVYIQDKSPFYNIDSAYKFLNIADKAFQNSDEKVKEDLQLLQINQEEINKQHVILASKFYVIATNENTQESYQYFIDYHPLATDREEAIKLRNHLAFEKAEDKNTLDGYASFMKNFPDAEDYNLAQQLFYVLEYGKYTEKGNAFSYQVFVKNKPDNPFVLDAHLEIYNLYTASGKAQDYETFIDENPDNPKVAEAWELLYALKTSSGEPAAIAEFILDYPDFPNQSMVKQNLVLSQLTYIPVQNEGKMGFVDTNGAWLIKPTYEWAMPFCEGKAAVGLLGNSVYVNKEGKVLFNHMLSDAASFQQNRAIVEFNELFGVINFMGDTVIAIEYDELGEFSDGLIYAGKGDKYGYFNKNGKMVVPMKYDIAYDFDEGKALVGIAGSYGIINVLGQEIIPTMFEKLVLDSSVCIAKSDSLYGLITYGGDTVLPFEFERISGVSEGIIMAAKESEYQYYKVDGSLAFDRTFDYNEATFNYSGFRNGKARVSINNKLGIIDREGKKVYPAIFSDLGPYGALTPVNKTGLWGYANTHVKLEIPYKYQFAYGFEDSLAIVQIDTAWGVINMSNEFVIPPVYSSITRLDSLFMVQKNGYTGVLNDRNDTILAINFDIIRVEKIDNYITFVTSQQGKQGVYWPSRNRFIYREQ